MTKVIMPCYAGTSAGDCGRLLACRLSAECVHHCNVDTSHRGRQSSMCHILAEDHRGDSECWTGVSTSSLSSSSSSSSSSSIFTQGGDLLILIQPHSLRVRRSTFGTHALSVAKPTVCNSLPDHLHDPAVDSKQFRRDLRRICSPDI